MADKLKKISYEQYGSWLPLMRPNYYLIFVFHPDHTVKDGVDVYHVFDQLEAEDYRKLIDDSYFEVCGSCGVKVVEKHHQLPNGTRIKIQENSFFVTNARRIHDYTMLCDEDGGNKELLTTFNLEDYPILGPVVCVPHRLFL